MDEQYDNWTEEPKGCSLTVLSFKYKFSFITLHGAEVRSGKCRNK